MSFLWVNKYGNIGIITAEELLNRKWVKEKNPDYTELPSSVGLPVYEDTYAMEVYVNGKAAFNKWDFDRLIDLITYLGADLTILLPREKYPALFMISGSEKTKLFFVLSPSDTKQRIIKFELNRKYKPIQEWIRKIMQEVKP